MLILNTMLPVANVITNIRRLEVIEVRDERVSLVYTPEPGFEPSLAICVRALGGGGVPYGVYWLRATNSGACKGLDINNSPTTDRDQLKEVVVSLPGTPYTTLKEIFWGNVAGAATAEKHLRAVEDAIKFGGPVQLIVSPALATTYPQEQHPMPPPPIHGMRAESEPAAWHRCANKEGGPVHEIKKELAAMGAKLEAATTATVELKTTFRTGAWWSAMSVSALAVAVAVLAYLATTRTGERASHVVPQAHAETKGSP